MSGGSTTRKINKEIEQTPVSGKKRKRGGEEAGRKPTRKKEGPKVKEKTLSPVGAAGEGKTWGV